MKRKLFKIFNFLFFLALGLLLLYLAFRDANLEDLIADLKKANYFWIILSLLFALIGYASRAYRWRLLIEPLNYNPSFKNVFHALMFGYFANLAFPRIGEISRCGALTKSDKIPMDSLIGTVLIERAIDVVVLLILLFIIFIAKIESFGLFIQENVFIPLSQKVIHTIDFSIYYWIGIILLIGVSVFLIYFFRKKFKRVKVVIKIRKLIRGVVSGVKTVTRMRSRSVFLLHTVIIWAMYFLMTYVALFSIPATQNLTPIDGLFLLVIGGLGMSAPVQGGIGAFHWIISSGLTLYGISKTEGLVLATILHESQVVLVLVLGIIAVITLFLIPRSKRKNNR
ncbi:MAG TPA: lysylphosphatidylglycerol synthase transmembrane domain-containing protein [Bacteroidales bacterium]|nr:lysylphosphatidylglycerol synthase transmembrane domain-containing protein [Bacteroidales bacterium]